jgi:DNA modification methylase
MKESRGIWRNRIVGYGSENPSQLLANEKNWRIHPRAQQLALSGILQEIGIVQNVIVNLRKGDEWPDDKRNISTVVDGHARIGIAISEQQPSIPITYVDLSPSEEDEILGTFDPISAMAGADADILKGLLGDISSQDEALQSLLSDLAKSAGIIMESDENTDAEPQIDRAEELAKSWGTEPGQLWLIGEHRLFCGDSTNADNVVLALGGNKPILMVTDPPWGVEYDANWRNSQIQNGKVLGRGTIGARAIGKVDNDDRMDWSDAWKLFSGDVMYVWHAGIHCGDVQRSIEESDFTVHSQIIWSKNNIVISRGYYHNKHEPCFYAVRNGKTALWIGDRKQNTIWEIDKPTKSETGHSTQKPLECMSWPIRNHSSDFVYDPFLGSGTTMVACQNLNRKCIGLEINPGYVAVCLQRMHDAFPEIKIEKV